MAILCIQNSTILAQMLVMESRVLMHPVLGLWLLQLPSHTPNPTRTLAEMPINGNPAANEAQLAKSLDQPLSVISHSPSDAVNNYILTMQAAARLFERQRSFHFLRRVATT